MDAVILDPEVAPLLAEAPQFALTPDALATMRENRINMMGDVELSDAVERTDHVVSTDPEVVVRVHRPKSASGRLPVIYSIHGGGYILGSYVMDDVRFDRWCPALGCVGVSVEYRLAPETPYPGPLDDCYAGLTWTYEHAAEIGADPAHIGIAGVSAGGGLAAALALLARDRGEISLCFQLLECPMIDDTQSTSSSCLDGLPIWSRESNTFGWKSYLGDLYGTGDIPAYAAAARATDLTGLPPALVIVGGADGFRDENITYALRLNQAGVPTELHVLPGAPHGVMMFAASTVAKRWNQTVNAWLEIQLALCKG
ncbi:MAG TPA: alpha/beta hydrolase [Acidimicrobiia bacterium]|jgi:acetyl esterase/lipase